LVFSVYEGKTLKKQNIEVFTVAGGMKLAIEPIEGATTATIVWTVPVGSAGDPTGDLGAGESNVLSEIILRGAGDHTSREFSDALDRLGVQRATSSSGYAITVSATCMAAQTEETLQLLCDMYLRPRIEADALEASRELALQSLGSLTDDPQHFVSIKINEIAIPTPFNQHGYGSVEGLNALTPESLHASWKRRCRPTGSIMGIAGAINPTKIRDLMERLLEGWRGVSVEPKETTSASRGSIYEKQVSSQTHMCLALPSPREADDASLPHRLMVRVLGGGGMSNRLFSEVREKRGLCYSVGMNYGCGRDRGLSTIYAGSTPERASETLACIRTELGRMAQGVTEGEFTRAIIGLKSGIVMGGESTMARAAALAGDIFRRGHVRTLAEVVATVDRLTLQQVNDHAAQALAPQRIDECALAVVGPEPL